MAHSLWWGDYGADTEGRSLESYRHPDRTRPANLSFGGMALVLGGGATGHLALLGAGAVLGFGALLMYWWPKQPPHHAGHRRH